MKFKLILTMLLTVILISGSLGNSGQENEIDELIEKTNEKTQNGENDNMQKTEEYTGNIYVNKVNNATIHSYVA